VRVEPISASYRERDARLATMDEQGLADPASFIDELHAFTPAEVHRIMRENYAELVGLSA
jgi:hypothetical protein